MYPFSEKYMDLSEFRRVLPESDAERIIIFGAGPFGEGLYHELLNLNVPFPICFSDNDRTKHDSKFFKSPVVPVEQLCTESDLVIIATLSGQNQISGQLSDLGFLKNRTFFPVMKNADYDYPFFVVDFFKKYVPSFENLNILHIGPGGNLGVELILSCLSGRKVESVEYNSYGICYPDVTSMADFYRQFNRKVKNRFYIDLFNNGLLKQDSGERLHIDTDFIALHYPCSASDIPAEDSQFDMVLHHAVFEHVSELEESYREVYRVLKTDGRMMCMIDPQDHRCFSSDEMYHPLKFLEYSREKWYKISENISYHNQVTAPEHRDMILFQGFQIEKWENLKTMEISDDMWNTFHPMFRLYDREDIGVLRFALLARK